MLAYSPAMIRRRECQSFSPFSSLWTFPLLWRCLWEGISGGFCFWSYKHQPEASFPRLSSIIPFPIKKSPLLTRGFETITREFSFFPITCRKQAHTIEQLETCKRSAGEKTAWGSVTVSLGGGWIETLPPAIIYHYVNSLALSFFR